MACFDCNIPGRSMAVVRTAMPSLVALFITLLSQIEIAIAKYTLGYDVSQPVMIIEVAVYVYNLGFVIWKCLHQNRRLFITGNPTACDFLSKLIGPCVVYIGASVMWFRSPGAFWTALGGVWRVSLVAVGGVGFVCIVGLWVVARVQLTRRDQELGTLFREDADQDGPGLYAPLKYRHIRLLKVYRSSRGVHCEVVCVPLTTTLRYEAISYTWGDPRQKHMLNIGGYVLPVTSNVWNILQDLAPDCATRYLWIDSICINQGNHDEKGQQVRLMREIFNRATQVIIWLGDAPGAKDANAFIRELADWEKRRSDIGQLGGLPLSDQIPGLRALRAMLNHPFWSRVWIIQEVAVASSLTLFYGGEFIDWNTFMAATVPFNMLENGSFVLIMGATEGESRGPRSGMNFVTRLTFHRQTYQMSLATRREQMSLPNVLVECCQSAATKPVDKFFALRGISAEADTDVLLPNYDLTVQEVYTETALHALRCGSFSLFGLAGIHSDQPQDRLPGLPSWIADLSAPPSIYPLDNPRSTYGAGGQGPPNFKISRDSPGCLEIEGFFIDEISQVTTTPLTYGKSFAGLDVYNAEVADMVHDMLERHIEILRMAKLNTPDPYHFLNSQPLPEAIFRTMIGDEDPSTPPDGGTGSSRPIQRSLCEDWALYIRCLRMYDQRNVPQTVDGMKRCNLVVKRMNILMSRRVSSRQFAVTNIGYLALVPQGAKPGDRLCVFSGSRTPHLLRCGEASLGGKYQLVGEAYVHGLMDGEGLKKDFQWFTIC